MILTALSPIAAFKLSLTLIAFPESVTKKNQKVILTYYLFVFAKYGCHRLIHLNCHHEIATNVWSHEQTVTAPKLTFQLFQFLGH